MIEKRHVLLLSTIVAFALFAKIAIPGTQSGDPDRPIVTGTLANPDSAASKASRLARLEALSLPDARLQRLESIARDISESMQEWAETRAQAMAGQPRRLPGRSAIESEITAAFPEATPMQKVGLHLIVLELTMGQLADELWSVAEQLHRDDPPFRSRLVQSLAGVRKARARVIRNFAASKPPRAADSQQAAPAQDRSSRYTQFVRPSELQSAEGGLVDALETLRGRQSEIWQADAALREMAAGTERTVR